MLLASRTACTVCSSIRLVNYTFRHVFSHGSCLSTKMKRSASGVMLRHLRYREKVGGQLDPPGTIELVVIGSGVNGTPKSFVINTDHIRQVTYNIIGASTRWSGPADFGLGVQLLHI